jgi:hypothetical protein
MKALIFAALMFSASTVAQANVVETHFKNIQNKIRSCVVLPYSVKNQHRVYQNLISHCPEVKVVAKGKASIKVGSNTFQAILVETEYSDGDVFDIVIREARSHDQLRLSNVLAFGDILLGLLGGSFEGLQQTYVPAALNR